MSAVGRLTQYINPLKPGTMTEMDRRIFDFIGYLSHIGVIASQNDSFIVKRRYNILTKDQKDEADTDKIFEESSINILTGFFEERPEELAQGLLDGWKQSILEKEQRQKNEQEQQEKSREVLSKILTTLNQKLLKQTLLRKWREETLLVQISLLKKTIEDERKNFGDKDIELKIQLREQGDYILELEDRLKNEMQDKKKKKDATVKRKKMKKNREISMSLSQSKVNRENSQGLNCEDPYMVNDSRKLIDLEKHLNIKSQRQAFGIDQRGSVNTLAAMRRKKLSLSKKGYSLATASVATQRIGSEFSFHPEINRDSKWKPKYDDHHDHVKMWERMHDENRKISALKRLLSQEKQLREVEDCTFTPMLVARQNKNKRDKPLDVQQLSERMYEYASKFKEKKEAIKK